MIQEGKIEPVIMLCMRVRVCVCVGGWGGGEGSERVREKGREN